MHPRQTAIYCRLAHTLPAEPIAAREARSHVRQFLTCHGLADLADDATLLASELVSNALRHACGKPELRISLSSDVLRLEVVDGGPGFPSPRTAEDGDTDGRGLWLVDRMAAHWGFNRANSIKSVWCELAIPA
ncbi:ATP-binding protein [Streptodolium elevatio]|uniref:ATP-binding protein n=1 Tax=Streptodolium elevatio TaxID=3157996 RepID=A0ABV3D9S7_9ACTN